MMGKLKAIGPAIAMVAAVAALSPATALAGEFHSEGAHSVISGSLVGESKWTFNAGTVTCQEATYSGTLSAATSTTTKVTPSYSGCKAFGFVNTTIDVNGCQYEFSGDNANMDIICPKSPMTVTAFNCWVTIVTYYVFDEDVIYTNYGVGSSRHISDNLHIETKYIQHSKTFPGCSNGTFTNGTFSETITTRCRTLFGVQLGCWRQ